MCDVSCSIGKHNGVTEDLLRGSAQRSRIGTISRMARTVRLSETTSDGVDGVRLQPTKRAPILQTMDATPRAMRRYGYKRRAD